MKQPIIDKVERDGFAFVLRDIMDEAQLFQLALEMGYGFSMEPWNKRLVGVDHPLITKITTSEVISVLVAQNRELAARASRQAVPSDKVLDQIITKVIEYGNRCAQHAAWKAGEVTRPNASFNPNAMMAEIRAMIAAHKPDAATDGEAD